MNNSKVLHNITLELMRYLNDNPSIKSLIIGVSGGIDSALCCALANYALRTIDSDVKLIGISIPISSTSEEEKERANLIGAAFCDSYHENNLTSTYEDVKYDLNFIEDFMPVEFDLVVPEDGKSEKIRSGNLKARLRMMYLYHLASSYQGLVLSTDNWTEYLLGFWTLHGDVGDLGMVQELWKSEIYELSNWIVDKSYTFNSEQKAALKTCIIADPTDGLGITRTDLDQIMPKWENTFNNSIEGYQYVDELLKLIIYHNSVLQRKDSFYTNVSQRYLATQFKRTNPFNFKRDKIYED